MQCLPSSDQGLPLCSPWKGCAGQRRKEAQTCRAFLKEVILCLIFCVSEAPLLASGTNQTGSPGHPDLQPPPCSPLRHPTGAFPLGGAKMWISPFNYQTNAKQLGGVSLCCTPCAEMRLREGCAQWDVGDAIGGLCAGLWERGMFHHGAQGAVEAAEDRALGTGKWMLCFPSECTRFFSLLVLQAEIYVLYGKKKYQKKKEKILMFQNKGQYILYFVKC